MIRHPPQAASVQLEGAIQLDFDLLVAASDFPWVGAAKPIVRLLVLPAVLDSLFEDSVFITQSVPNGRQLHRGHRIEEARSQTPKAAVSQARIGFPLEQVRPVKVFSFDRLLGDGIE